MSTPKRSFHSQPSSSEGHSPFAIALCAASILFAAALLPGLHRSFSGSCEYHIIRGRAFALSRDVVTVPAVLTQEPRLVCLRQLCALQHRSHPVLDDPILHFDTAVGLVMFSWNYTQLDSFVSCPCCHVFAFKTLVTYRVMGAPLRGCFH